MSKEIDEIKELLMKVSGKAGSSNKPMESVVSFIKSQMEQLEKRIESHENLQETGVEIMKLLCKDKLPIDMEYGELLLKYEKAKTELDRLLLGEAKDLLKKYNQ